METRVFCVELKMGPSGHMDSTGIFPDSNTREFGPRRTTQRQPPRPTIKCNAPRLPFHVHLTHDLTRAASALPLHTAALAFVSFGIVLIQVHKTPVFLLPSNPCLPRARAALSLLQKDILNKNVDKNMTTAVPKQLYQNMTPPHATRGPVSDG